MKAAVLVIIVLLHSVSAWAQAPTYSASSEHFAFPLRLAFDGDRRSQGGKGTYFNDATPDEFPDWVEVAYPRARQVAQVDLVGVPDDQPVDVTEAATCSLYCLVDVDVQVWAASGWSTVATVRGNNRLWQHIAFSEVTTDRVRIVILRATDGWTRIAELAVDGPPLPPHDPLPTPGCASIATDALEVAPGYLCFEPSPDHDAMTMSGTPQITGYRLLLYAGGQDPTSMPPMQAPADLGKPTPQHGAMIVARSELGTLPPEGLYFALVEAYGPNGSSRSERSNPFTTRTAPVPRPEPAPLPPSDVLVIGATIPPACATAQQQPVISIGSVSRPSTLKRGAIGLAQFVVTSQRPVARIRVLLAGVEAGKLAGDVGAARGVSFAATTVGTQNLQIEVTDEVGCQVVTPEKRTVKVTP